MMRGVLCTVAVLLTAGAVPAAAQQPAFLFVAQQGANTATITSGATINLNATKVGDSVTFQFTATYRGTGTATVTNIQLVGSQDFQIAGIPTLPTTLNPGAKIALTITFTSSTISQESSQLVFSYFETDAKGVVSAVTPNTFTVNGGTADFLIAYVFPSNGNVQSVDDGGTILFPATPVNTTTTANVSIVNRGSAPAVINSVTLSAARFQLLSLPLLPASIDPGKAVQFAIQYQPREIQDDAGTLTVALNGRTVNIALAGSGTGPAFSYELVDSNNQPVTPGQTITVPDTQLGQTTLLSIRLRNTGNANGVISNISVVGSGYQIVSAPILPVTLTPGSAAILTLGFAATQAGRITGRLLIGGDSFDLVANALGVKFSYAYSNGVASVDITQGGAVIFSPTQVGQSSTVDFIVQNNGTQTASVGSIAITSGRSSFKLDNPPVLPAALAPGASMRFPIRFVASVTGPVTDTMQIDNQSFTLSGSGTAPPALPGYTLKGPGATVQPLDQPSLSLSLDSGYSIPLSGTLTVTFSSASFSDDPAIQFSTGKRVVGFTIPANSTDAIFENNAKQIRLQTGTVAGNIIVTPTFSTQAGLALSPPIQTLTTSVPVLPPALSSVTLAAKTANSFTLQIEGYATGRDVSTVEFQFTPAAGSSIATTTFSMDVSGASGVWFRSASSQLYGGGFSAAVTFVVAAPPGTVVATGTSTVDVIDSVTVTVASASGKSASVKAPIR
jgi:hypothetical protein